MSAANQPAVTIGERERCKDPLALAAIAESLAARLLPAFDGRLPRARFMTAVCAGIAVGGERSSAPAAPPPWLAFEWLVVEALVRASTVPDREGIPGWGHVRRALRQRRAVSAATYLPSPAETGFTAAARCLLTSTGLVEGEVTAAEGAKGHAARLTESGTALVAAWEKDLGRDGFVRGADRFHAELRRAVDATVAAGKVGEHPTSFWCELAAAVEPTAIQPRERGSLLAALVTPARGPHRGHGEELVDALLVRGASIERGDEAALLRGLLPGASAELAPLLGAIDAFEALARPLSDVFDLSRMLSTRRARRPIGPSEFASHHLAPQLVAAVASGVRRVLADPQLGTWAPAALVLARSVVGTDTAAGLFTATMERHEQAMRGDGDGPSGRPWFKVASGGRAVRISYTIDRIAELDGSYSHEYRIATLSRLLAELRALT